MKILYISNSAAPSKNASSLQIIKHCEALQKLKNEVILILPNTGISKNLFNFYSINKKFKIIRLKFFKKFPLGVYYYLYSLMSVLVGISQKANLYITRNFFVCFLLILFNKKIIFEIHDSLNVEGRVVRFIQRIFKFLNSKNIIKIITTTNSLKINYSKYWSVNSKKITVLHNASSLKTKFVKSFNKKKLNIGYFGSVFQSRGIQKIIDLSKKDYKNNYYIFGGDKKEIFNLKKIIKNTNIFFSPYIPYNKVLKELNKIDICLLPYNKRITVAGNIGNIYKFTSPLKVFDYMIAGKLIICSDIPVIREILKHKHNSILIKNFNQTNVWLSTIKKISNNFKHFDKLRFNAYSYANKKDITWRAKKLLENIKV